MDVVWPLEPNTIAKHRLYARYLAAWWPKLLQPVPGRPSFPRVTYLDAFAGPGRYQGGQPGSPLLAVEQLLTHTARERMHLSRDRVKMLFIEKDPRRHNHLQQELNRTFGPLEQLPIDVRAPYCGEAAIDTIPLLTAANAWGNPILAIFDSWGNVNVPLDVMAKIAHNTSSEVIVTFGPNWFNRRHTLDPDVLDTVFGGRRYWQPADATVTPSDRWRAWLETYQQALRRAGFRFTLQFEVVPETGLPLYLVYGTGARAGLDAMKAAMWSVDGNDGLSFRDPRLPNTPSPDQPSFFDDATGTNTLELDELIRQKLSTGPASVADLREWLLTETSRWREMHASAAVRRLRDNLTVDVQPAGRVTRESVVRLR